MQNGTRILDLEVKEGGINTMGASNPTPSNPGGGGRPIGACCCVGCVGNVTCTNDGNDGNNG